MSSPEVDVVTVPAQLAAVCDARVTFPELADTIRSSLDDVWAHIRAVDNLEPGHNVVVYRGQLAAGPADVEIGVQIDRSFDEPSATGVRCAELPSGRAAHVIHCGPYDQMRSAYDALHAWAQAGGHRLTGPSWEIYGDWTDDVSKLETDIYFLLAPE